jgi:hypothetical protein
MLKLQILELKATQSQFWCSVQWCDGSVTVMPSSSQTMPEHTTQSTYYAKVIARAGRNFFVLCNESSAYWH